MGERRLLEQHEVGPLARARGCRGGRRDPAPTRGSASRRSAPRAAAPRRRLHAIAITSGIETTGDVPGFAVGRERDRRAGLAERRGQGPASREGRTSRPAAGRRRSRSLRARRRRRGEQWLRWSALRAPRRAAAAAAPESPSWSACTRSASPAASLADRDRLEVLERERDVLHVDVDGVGEAFAVRLRGSARRTPFAPSHARATPAGTAWAARSVTVHVCSASSASRRASRARSQLLLDREAVAGLQLERGRAVREHLGRAAAREKASTSSSLASANMRARPEDAPVAAVQLPVRDAAAKSSLELVGAPSDERHMGVAVDEAGHEAARDRPRRRTGSQGRPSAEPAYTITPSSSHATPTSTVASSWPDRRRGGCRRAVAIARRHDRPARHRAKLTRASFRHRRLRLDSRTDAGRTRSIVLPVPLEEAWTRADGLGAPGGLDARRRQRDGRVRRARRRRCATRRAHAHPRRAGVHRADGGRDLGSAASPRHPPRLRRDRHGHVAPRSDRGRHPLHLAGGHPPRDARRRRAGRDAATAR